MTTLFFVEATVTKSVDLAIWSEDRIHKTIIVAENYDEAVLKYFQYWEKRSTDKVKFTIHAYNITEAIT